MNFTTQIENILSCFDIELSNFEIINIEEKKGWSSRYLYLIVEKNNQFVLKGKDKDQLGGYLSDIAISNFLKANGFDARISIKTKDDKYHFLSENLYWELKTYVAGSVEEFANYTDKSVKSLAEVNISYIKSSLNNKSINTLGLEKKDFLDIKELKATIINYKDILKSVIGSSPDLFEDWFHFAHDEIKLILNKNTDISIIHNDLNNKNILLDLSSMKVTSFIDWDHGCISTTLKDITEPINMFYDFVIDRYDELKLIYLNEIKKHYSLKVSETELDFLQVYFYALNKWKYINFFAKLIRDLGNSTNELTVFEEQIHTQFNKLNDLGSRCNVF